ncbi:MAG: hypothetical protein IJW44_03245 [Clostridia bacterium]|nr:hypothetical protein [Clostridia bacterium]
MSKFTYEFEDRTQGLETYEWDNVWWEHADTVGVPRVLYIGDSISCGTRRVATRVAEGKIFFDGFGTSKAVDNRYFSESVRTFAAQQGERRVILFNNGLHGWHLEDETEYAAAYERMLVSLLEEYPGTPILLLLTTHVTDESRDARVQARNRVVRALGEKHGLPTVDLYRITREHAELISADGVHLVPEGYELLARAIVEAVTPYI